MAESTTTRVEVPRLNTNDDSAFLIEWVASAGQKVKQGDVLCVIETSKATVEIESPASGFLLSPVPAQREVKVGELLAVVSASLQPGGSDAMEPEAVSAPQATGFTQKALALVNRHNLDKTVFRHLALVREADVAEYLRTLDEKSAQVTPLNPVQLRAARVLTRSKQTVPHSYLSRFLPADAIDELVSGIAGKEGAMVSVSDWLAWSVARELRNRPKARATWSEQGLVIHPDVSLCVAINQSDGTVVAPVIRNADSLDVVAFSGAIRKLQMKSLRGRLEPEDLSGGNCTVTSLIGSGVHQVIPIIYPGQSIIFGIADAWRIGENGYYTLTASFDHRVLNGAEAGEILGSVAERMLGKHEEHG